MRAGTYNWGIIGTGAIAAKFAEGLRFARGAKPYAVASRDPVKAGNFARQFGIPVSHGSYEALANDPDVDIVYVATPNNLHHQNTLMCLEAGKATLCEKPFALDVSQSREMVELARRKNVFLMEALWTRFLPTVQAVKRLVDAGAIGDVHILKADFGFKAQYNPEGRLFNPGLGGGALLDIGIYPVFLSLFLLGKPTSVKALAVNAPTGTDLTNAIVFAHERGRISVLASSFAVDLQTEAVIAGTGGHMTLHRMFHMPTRVSLTRGGKTEYIPLEITGNGYNYEAEEVMRCLDEGKTESDFLPLGFSLDVVEVLGEILSQFGG